MSRDIVARRLIAPAPSDALAAASRVVVVWGVAFPLVAVAAVNMLDTHPALVRG